MAIAAIPAIIMLYVTMGSALFGIGTAKVIMTAANAITPPFRLLKRGLKRHA